LDQRLPNENVHVVVLTDWQDACSAVLSMPVVPGLHHPAATLSSVSGLVDVLAAEGDAEVTHLALSDLLVQRLPHVVSVKDPRPGRNETASASGR
jgi:hypothetical protein